MPIPLPDASAAELPAPDLDEVIHITRGLKTAMSPPAGLSELQHDVLVAITVSMTGHELDLDSLEPLDATSFAAGLAHRDLRFRTEMVQLMDLGHMLLPDPDPHVADAVVEYAAELSVDTGIVAKAQELAAGSAELVAADIDRAGYITKLDLSGFTPLRSADDNIEAWTSTAINDELAGRWTALGDLPPGSLGRAVHDFYRARGFNFPGRPSSAPPLLAQHDWVHVLADYGSQLESEIEVFAFMARASDDPEAFALLGMAITLFHTGLLPSAAGFFEADGGNMHKDGMPVRLGDAFRRGALTNGSIDFIGLDYFSIADRPIDDVRDELGIVPKSETAIAAGSTGPFEPGGISETQIAMGTAMAEREGRPYDAFGAV